MTSNQFLAQGGAWVVAQNLLTLAALVLAPLARAQAGPAAAKWAGGALLLAGAGFGLAGVRALGRNRTPFPRPVEEGALVQTGIYAVVRHPLYTSLMLLGAGWSAFWWSWPAAAAALLLCLVLWGKARLEERWLRQRHADYADYARRVPRFLPGL